MIFRSRDGYAAQVTPPESGDAPWQSSAPVTCASLVDDLRDLGCSEDEIALAFFTWDPEWLMRDRKAQKRALSEQGHEILMTAFREQREPTESEAAQMKMLADEGVRIRRDLDEYFYRDYMNRPTRP